MSCHDDHAGQWKFFWKFRYHFLVIQGDFWGSVTDTADHDNLVWQDSLFSRRFAPSCLGGKIPKVTRGSHFPQSSAVFSNEHTTSHNFMNFSNLKLAYAGDMVYMLIYNFRYVWPKLMRYENPRDSLGLYLVKLIWDWRLVVTVVILKQTCKNYLGSELFLHVFNL